MNDRDSQCRKVIASLVRRREEIIDKALVRAHARAMGEGRQCCHGEDDEADEADIEEDSETDDRDVEEGPRVMLNSVAQVGT